VGAGAHRRSLGFARDDKGEGGDLLLSAVRSDGQKETAGPSLRCAPVDHFARKIIQVGIAILWRFDEKHPKQAGAYERPQAA
jgi:hypothetical protein